MKTNTVAEKTRIREGGPRTAGGALAATIGAEQELRRSVMACLLWEDTFYEEGISIAERIGSLIPKVGVEKVSAIAIEAREKMKLRHVPLLLCRELARNKMLKADVLARVIQRADELAEYVSLCWKPEKQPLSAQSKKGLALAFQKFDAYSLAKYNRDGAIKLRDVLFLCHAKPKDKEQEATWKQLIDNKLPIPDTWEVAISAAKPEEKKLAWERLLKEGKLFALALLRNLRNFKEAGVDESLVLAALKNIKTERVLPFRFIAAAKHVPQWEPQLEEAMFKCSDSKNKLGGKTVLILDVSGSMGGRLSAKSELDRLDAACGLAILARELCQQVVIYATAGNDFTMVHATQLLPARRGFALRDAFQSAAQKLGGGGIFLKQVMDFTHDKEQSADRVIVVTDEQDCDQKCNPVTALKWGKNNYLVNISCQKNGIGYKGWTHIDGWSESILNYILESERLTQ